MNVNTELCIDLKTKLQNEALMRPGKEYLGVLRRDEPSQTLFGPEDAHFTFTEVRIPTAGKRNPHVFEGRYITVTLRDDGTLRLNFKPVRMDARFSIDSYAIGVMNEIRQALEGLVEK